MFWLVFGFLCLIGLAYEIVVGIIKLLFFNCKHDYSFEDYTDPTFRVCTKCGKRRRWGKRIESVKA